MKSLPDSKPINPDDAVIARADERLAHAYDQIARADKQLARLTEQLAKIESEAVHPPSPGPGPQPPSGRPALRAGIGLALAVCIIVGPLVLQSSYGSGAKLIVARWAPHLLAHENLVLPEQPAPSPIQVAVAEVPLPQETTLAQNASQDVAQAPAAAVPDHTQLLQTMSRDLANVQRQIEELKANQQELASDNLKAIEQLKANQQEMTRLLGTVSGQILPKPSSVSTQPTHTSHKPERTLHSPQARARPPIPREWMYEDW